MCCSEECLHHQQNPESSRPHVLEPHGETKQVINFEPLEGPNEHEDVMLSDVEINL